MLPVIIPVIYQCLSMKERCYPGANICQLWTKYGHKSPISYKYSIDCDSYDSIEWLRKQIDRDLLLKTTQSIKINLLQKNIPSVPGMINLHNLDQLQSFEYFSLMHTSIIITDLNILIRLKQLVWYTDNRLNVDLFQFDNLIKLNIDTNNLILLNTQILPKLTHLIINDICNDPLYMSSILNRDMELFQLMTPNVEYFETHRHLQAEVSWSKWPKLTELVIHQDHITFQEQRLISPSLEIIKLKCLRWYASDAIMVCGLWDIKEIHINNINAISNSCSPVCQRLISHWEIRNWNVWHDIFKNIKMSITMNETLPIEIKNNYLPVVVLPDKLQELTLIDIEYFSLDRKHGRVEKIYELDYKYVELFRCLNISKLTFQMIIDWKILLGPQIKISILKCTYLQFNNPKIIEKLKIYFIWENTVLVDMEGLRRFQPPILID